METVLQQMVETDKQAAEQVRLATAEAERIRQEGKRQTAERQAALEAETETLARALLQERLAAAVREKEQAIAEYSASLDKLQATFAEEALRQVPALVSTLLNPRAR